MSQTKKAYKGPVYSKLESSNFFSSARKVRTEYPSPTFPTANRARQIPHINYQQIIKILDIFIFINF